MAVRCSDMIELRISRDSVGATFTVAAESRPMGAVVATTDQPLCLV
jgi:hypothetical protein